MSIITCNQFKESRGKWNMHNVDIKQYALEKCVNLWEISERLGYAHESSFSRLLRHELTKDKKKEIRAIIDELAAK